MFEIELKAHVHDRVSVLQKLNSFATFDKIIVKDDEYLMLPTNGGHITARLRTEEQWATGGTSNFLPETLLCKKSFLTYKKKERRVGADGKCMEVNDERETELTDSDCVKSLLLDSGFVPDFKKHKDTVGFFANTECGKAHLELCAVPPLGHFLEIEFVLQDADSGEQEKIRKALEGLVLKCGLSIEDIENKYYSELLKEAQNV